ncbi:amino acid transporter [Dothidotthia symphoricarpi CBS 119687]|uniref:Amino acid transporter n=1 Tax=Dothidotthia symphoricarpi CBS 119687 TaxID=1392245 RepID=A0A6A6APW5_9PLEO|nr:amino acid transporter [Dothidotthia symphoricarpi CBS 119687]KAF2132907.1 amino acid transporter [Dothidotthia symphoricarpi CBS 119687]
MAPSPTKRRSVAEEPVTSVLPDGDVPYDPTHEFSADDEALAALGYKSEFKREFSLFTTFCVSFAVLGLLPSFASTMYYGLGYAGTAGMTWGWLIAMIGIQSVACSMAEICSSMPTSGGLYYASAVLAPPGWGPFAAWITGWSNWFAQISGAPSVNYGVASMILAAASINNPDYIPSTWQTFLVTVFLMIIHSVMSSLPTRWLAKINSGGSTFNFIALIIVIIMIPAGTDRQSRGLPRFEDSSVVWGSIYEGTSFPAGISVLMSFISVIWTMSGYDSPFHLAEECSNASIAAPRAIVLTSATGGLFGWFLQLVVAYTVVDIDEVLASDLGQPFAAYLMQCMSQKLTLAILAMTIIAGFSMGQGCMIAASRVTFAYARDDCFPLSKFWKQVNPITKTPVNAVWLNCGVGIILLLLMFGGELAVGALFSIGAIAAFVAFTTPIFIRVFFVGNRFRPGPWNLGKFSIPTGIVASAFVILMIPVLCLPTITGSELTAADMNWTCVVYGGPMTLIMIWWVVSARKWFKGPKVNIDHMMLGREGNVVMGVGDESSLKDRGSLSEEGKLSDKVPVKS